MLSPVEFIALLIATTAFAFVRGDRELQTAAIICVAGSFLTPIVSTSAQSSFGSVEAGILMVDSAALVAFTFLAMRSSRFWPLWVAGLQLTSIFSHGLKAVHIGMIPQVYAAAERFWIYPIFAVIIIGVIRHHRRELLLADQAPS